MLRFLLLGSVAAGGVFAYALFNSDMPQAPALAVGQVGQREGEGGEGPCDSLQVLGAHPGSEGPGAWWEVPSLLRLPALLHPPPQLLTAPPTTTPGPHLDYLPLPSLQTPTKRDYAEVRKALEGILDVEGYDDGSYGPLLVRQG